MAAPVMRCVSGRFTTFCSRYLRCTSTVRRTFLSAAYRCEKAFKERLEEPVLKDINPSVCFVQLDKQFSLSTAIAGVDFDLYVNSAIQEENLYDLEDVIHRFRHTPNAVQLLPSSAHAIVRHYLQFGEYGMLMRILNSRQDYGIFPDYYCYNLMMDTFLKQENFSDATKVAILMVLQEDFDNALSKHLALHSCLSLLKNEGPWEAEPLPPPPEDPPEQIIIRLTYLPPNYFDDHFDLKDPKILIGKTLSMLGKQFDGQLGRTCQLIGLGMHGKWDKVETLAINWAEQKRTVFKEGVDRVRELIENIPDDESGTRRSVGEKLTPALDRLQTTATDGDVLEASRELTVEAVKQHEADEIKKQVATYKLWAQVRVDEIRLQAKEKDRSARLKRIEEMREDLHKREQLLFFFENFETHALNVEKYEAVEREMNKMEMEKKKKEEEEYIPPDVSYKPAQPVK